MSTDPYELLTYGYIRKLKLDTPSALFKLCCKFVFKAVSDGGDFYIDPPRLLRGRVQWQFNEFGHCRERGLQTPAGPLIYLNFAECKKMYEHRLNLDGQYYLNAAASEGSDWQHTVRREDYFFFNLKSEAASAFFGQNLCLKELLPRPFGLRSRPNQRAPKRSQLFVMREHDYYRQNEDVDECPICEQELTMDDMEILWCGHAFHNECLFKNQEESVHAELKAIFHFQCFVCEQISK